MTQKILIARENDREALRVALGEGRLERLRWGAYRTPDPGSDPVAEQRRAMDRVRAVDAQLRAEHVFSHDSAALIRRMRMWELPERTHVLQRYRASGAAARDIVRRRPLPDHSEMVDGLPVTTTVETVADCLRSMHPLHGLVLLDGALADGLDEAAVRTRIADVGKQRGRARASLLLRLADAEAASAWETWVRYLALRAGLPRPRTQFPVVCDGTIYRVDLAWPEHQVLVEFDGKVKYVDGVLGPGHDPDQQRFADKVREDAITAVTGVRPLRLTARDSAEVATRKLLRQFRSELRADLRVDPRLPWPVPRRSLASRIADVGRLSRDR